MMMSEINLQSHRNLFKLRWPMGVFLCSCLAMLLASCGTEKRAGATVAASKVVLTGSSTVAPLVMEIGLRYEAQQPGLRVDVQTGGSSRGIADARSGVADLGMSSRALKLQEAEDLQEHLIAFDGVAFVVHASNPLTELSDEHLLAIYRGEIEDWSEVGGTAGELTVVTRANGRSEVELITQYLGLEPSEIRADLVSGENQHALKTVAGDPAAIVYVSLGAAERESAAGAPIKLLSLRGVAATSNRLAAGDYPLARPLVLLSQGEPQSTVADFLAFARSSQVDDLIESLAYVPPDR